MRRRKIILTLTPALVIFGLVMIGSSSVVDAARDFGDKWYYLKIQSVWTIIGLVVFFIVQKINFKKFEKYSLPILAGSLILLLLVLIPGVGIKILGARRWINLGIFSFQPAEIAKLALVIYLSTLLKKAGRFWPFIIILLTVSGLVFIQPDMGTALVIFLSAICVYFASPNQIRYLFIFSPLALLILVLMIIISPYRLDRLRTFMDQSRDPLGSSYQIRQALIGLGSGGITGVGLGQSKQKFQYLPEVTTDSIFAVVGEEFGIFGTGLLVLAYLTLILTGYQIALAAKDMFSRLLVIGIISMISFQALINISANIALLPFTGVPLPFISYGRTSMVILLIGMGIVANIAGSADYG